MMLMMIITIAISSVCIYSARIALSTSTMALRAQGITEQAPLDGG